MGSSGAGGFFVLIILAFLAFIGFCIYFIFKQLQFVIMAINLYKKMINREDAILKVLVDIRDNTKKFSDTDSVGSADRECPSCNASLSKADLFCPECGAKP
jgi:hypothetical protein